VAPPYYSLPSHGHAQVTVRYSTVLYSGIENSTVLYSTCSIPLPLRTF